MTGSTGTDLMSVFPERWKLAWRLPAFRRQTLWSTLSLVVVLMLVRLVLDQVEGRHGVVLIDPLLTLIPPIDLHWVTWTLTYSGILLGIALLCFQPFPLLLFVRSVIVLTILRVICLSVLPLDPPSGVIPLVDPLLQLPFVKPVLTRDLYFSWHTAALSLFAFLVPGRDMRIILASLAGLVAIFLLVQHVQYTFSILSAPCFAYAALGLARSVTVGARPAPVAGFGGVSQGWNKPLMGQSIRQGGEVQREKEDVNRLV